MTKIDVPGSAPSSETGETAVALDAPEPIPREAAEKPTFNRPLFALFAIASLAAIFYVPYWVPVAPSTSESWIFGYNNRVGQLLLLTAVLMGVLWTRGMTLRLPPPCSQQKLPFKVLAVSLLAYLLASTAMYVFAGRYGGFGESFYLIDRTWLLEHGRQPYVDFEYCFGLSYLYGPLFIEHLLHISLIAAYHVFWILNGLTDVVLLYAITNRVNFPSPARLSIYLLLFVSTLMSVLSMGANYAGTRFLFPIWFVLVIRRKLESTKTRDRIYAMVFTLTAALFMFFFSSETPIALSFAGVCLYIFSVPKWTKTLGIILVADIIAVAALFWGASRSHVFDSIKTDGAGANSFPIALSPHILFFIATVFLAGCYLYTRLQQHSLNDDCATLIIYSVPMLAAALGRCDPGHLVNNGEGLFVASMFYVSNFKVPWRRYRLVYVVFILLLPALTGLIVIGSEISSVSSMNSAGTNPNAQADLLEQAFPEWNAQFSAPFSFRPNRIGTYLSTRIDYGRFDGTQNLNTLSGVAETVDHINSHPEEALILPAAFEDSCRVNEAGGKLVMSLLFDTIYMQPVAHPESIRKPICEHIRAHYEMVRPPSRRSFGYGLWVRKHAVAPEPQHAALQRPQN